MAAKQNLQIHGAYGGLMYSVFKWEQFHMDA